MTKQYLQNNLIFCISYDNTTVEDYVEGYKIQQRDPSIDWNMVNKIEPAPLQMGESISVQKLVNKFYDQLEYGWDSYLDKLVADKEIQDVPDTFCH